MVNDLIKKYSIIYYIFVRETISPNPISNIGRKRSSMIKETIIDNDEIVGFVVNNLNGKTVPTSVFRIYYADQGIHIVPDYPSKKRGKVK